MHRPTSLRGFYILGKLYWCIGPERKHIERVGLMTSTGDFSNRIELGAQRGVASAEPFPRADRERATTDEVPLLSDAHTQGVNPSASATLVAQFWFERFPWRPTAAWSAVAALLSVAYFSTQRSVSGNIDWRALVLLLLLVDPLWGSLWRMAWGRDELLPLRQHVMTQKFWLPYLRTGSPAARIMGIGGERQGGGTVFPLLFRVALPSFLLAAGVALTLGLPALWMTVAVALCSILGWVNRRIWNRQTHLLHALVTIALPWSAALSLFGGGGGGVAAGGSGTWRLPVLLLLLWTVHNWGEGRCLRNPADRWGAALLGVADVGIGILLIVAKAPVWLALLVVLWLPTWLSIYYGRSLQRVSVWWLAAMLVSALAVGQRLSLL